MTLSLAFTRLMSFSVIPIDSSKIEFIDLRKLSRRLPKVYETLSFNFSKLAMTYLRLVR